MKTLAATLQDVTASALQKPFSLYSQVKNSLLSALQNSQEVYREKSGESLMSCQLAQGSHYALKGLLLSLCRSVGKKADVDMRFCSFLPNLERLWCDIQCCKESAH